MGSHRIKMESRVVFQAKTQAINFQLNRAPAELDGAEQAEAAAAIPVHLRRGGSVPAATGGQFPRRPRGGVPIVKVRFSQTAKIASH